MTRANTKWFCSILWVMSSYWYKTLKWPAIYSLPRTYSSTSRVCVMTCTKTCSAIPLSSHQVVHSGNRRERPQRMPFIRTGLFICATYSKVKWRLLSKHGLKRSGHLKIAQLWSTSLLSSIAFRHKVSSMSRLATILATKSSISRCYRRGKAAPSWRRVSPWERL